MTTATPAPKLDRSTLHRRLQRCHSTFGTLAVLLDHYVIEAYRDRAEDPDRPATEREIFYAQAGLALVELMNREIAAATALYKVQQGGEDWQLGEYEVPSDLLLTGDHSRNVYYVNVALTRLLDGFQAGAAWPTLMASRTLIELHYGQIAERKARLPMEPINQRVIDALAPLAEADPSASVEVEYAFVFNKWMVTVDVKLTDPATGNYVETLSTTVHPAMIDTLHELIEQSPDVRSLAHAAFGYHDTTFPGYFGRKLLDAPEGPERDLVAKGTQFLMMNLAHRSGHGSVHPRRDQRDKAKKARDKATKLWRAKRIKQLRSRGMVAKWKSAKA